MYEIFPSGVKTEPVFKSKEEYEKFSRDFWDSIKDDIKECDRKQAASWRAARFKYYC